MEPADRNFTEAPIFGSLTATSFTYAFELEYSDQPEPDARIEDCGEEQDIDSRHRAAFRLRTLSTALAALKSGDEQQRHIFRRLIQPVRSFLDDVTMGPAGSNGRPLLFAASGALPNAASRRAWLVRPERWDYEYENEVTRLKVPGPRCIELRLRDSFCAFESGRIFYLLTLTQEMPPEIEEEDEDGATASGAPVKEPTEAERMEAELDPEIEPADPPAIDEYAVLQLQQLVLDKKLDAKRAEVIGFSLGATPPEDGQAQSLLAFAEARLQQLEASTSLCPNGVRDVIRHYRLISPKPEVRRMRLGLRHLHRLCVGIESEEMLETAERVRLRFESAESIVAGADAAAVPLWESWRSDAFCPERKCDPPPHHQSRNRFDRTFLAFAGVAQAVPDFPWQDDSEIHDSTRPAAHSVESSMFVHPRFVLEVAKSWRSFEQARPAIGTCPYLLLMFMVALHDELIVAEMEEQIDDMVYAADTDAEGDGDYRVAPMHDVLDALAKADQVGDRGIDILKSNLERRFELFRWASIQRSGNIFRYPKERGALAAIQKAMGTDARFDRAHQIVDRMESLIEDVNRLKSGYADQRAAKADDDAKDADRRTQRLLFGIALLGVVSVSADIAGQFEAHRLWIFSGALAGFTIAIVIAVWLLILRRRPKKED
jgi:hypothetical protein